MFHAQPSGHLLGMTLSLRILTPHARGGHEGLVCSLLLGGACPSAKDKRGDSPLHLAAWRGRAGIASALLLKGADKNARDTQGRVSNVAIPQP